MKRQLGRFVGLDQQPVIMLTKQHPKAFGRLVRSLLNDSTLYEGTKRWPAHWNTTILGERVMELYGNQIGFRRRGLDFLRTGCKLEELVLSCELLRVELDALRVLRELKR